MRFELKDFQTAAVDAISRRLRTAIRDYEAERERFAVTLSAPTGAGKTVIAAALIEALFYGDQDNPPDNKAVVLWLTDDPHLNEQTRKKMLEASNMLTDTSLVTIDASFDQETFDPGRVYFLNIQKLAKDTQYTRAGDRRRFTLWDTVSRTAHLLGGHFLLVLDEAHRGMGSRDSERTTIASRFLVGGGGQPPVPVVLGISATPGRFNAKAREDRTFREHVVPVEHVRESGLLKEKILIWHPNESQPGDVTLAAQAVREWRQFHDRWDSFATRENIASVAPVLVVQIAPASQKATISATDLPRVLDAIQREDDCLVGRAIAHSLPETGGMPLVVAGQAIRYIEPEAIEDDPHVRMVLFKDALTTGWDCPRAEVMLSFRHARDDTYIAQLIGRMVRTPLARRVLDDSVLNTVSLFLPYFDEAAVDGVISHLKQDDVLPAVDVETSRAICTQNNHLPAQVFDLLAGLPSYLVPRVSRTSQVARLNKLAHRLAVDGILDEAEKIAAKYLLDALLSFREQLQESGRLPELTAAYASLGIGITAFDTFSGESVAMEAMNVPLDARNLDDLVRASGRRLQDGLVTRYWSHRYQVGGLDSYDAKLEAVALASVDEVVDAIETLAEQKVRAWLNDYDAQVRSLSDERRGRYYELRAQARQPEEVRVLVPDEIAVPDAERTWHGHLYCTPDGLFPLRLNTWEQRTLDAELADASCVGWFRNPARGIQSLALPYRLDETDVAMHPDFIVFHKVDDQVKPSVIDPHRYDNADAGPKLRGLSAYAVLHGDAYHRIDAVIVLDDVLLRLDMKDPNVQAAVRNVNGPGAVTDLFRAHGARY